MKSLMKITCFFALLLLGLQSSYAQNSTNQLSEEQKTEMKKNFEEFIKTLDLNEEQKMEFMAISEKYGQQMLALKESNAGKLSKYRKMKSISSARNKEMKKILSKEQYQLYVERQEEMQKEMKARHKG